ncbi:hypothetical protein Efla_003918 [Eimeria flavescens]
MQLGRESSRSSLDPHENAALLLDNAQLIENRFTPKNCRNRVLFSIPLRSHFSELMIAQLWSESHDPTRPALRLSERLLRSHHCGNQSHHAVEIRNSYKSIDTAVSDFESPTETSVFNETAKLLAVSTDREKV